MIRIIGTTHLHQPVAPGFLVPPDIEDEQKEHYRSLIDSFLAGTKGWFIGEEFTHGKETFASLHASDQDTSVHGDADARSTRDSISLDRLTAATSKLEFYLLETAECPKEAM
jgi:hypothetical protein